MNFKTFPLKKYAKGFMVIFMVLSINQLYGQTPDIKFEADRSILKVTKNTFEKTNLQYAFDGLDYVEVKTREGVYTELILPGGYSVGDLGAPKLPASKKLIEIPLGADVEVKVASYTTEEYKLSDFGIKHPIMPMQPSLRKDQDPYEVPFKYQANYYSKSGFVKPELASVEVLGVLRGMRIGRLNVAPVHYNPADGTIIVYNNIEIELQYIGADKHATKYSKAATYSPYFDVVYNSVVNPFETKDIFEDYPDLTKYPIKMVIVSDPEFETTLQPFIEWKTMQGFEIIEAYTDETGSSSDDIQDFIHSEYNAGTPEDPAPTFVILVGDADKIPASNIGSSSNKVTDLYYASVDGDYFPEMYLGRLSARNVQELQNQVDKIVYYQKYEFADPTYLNDVTLIAGVDGYWNPRVGQPTVNYGTENYFNAANGFNNVNAYLDSYDGCYDDNRIAVSMINYTAHCSRTSWGDPSLGVNDIHNMNNAGQYTLAVGNCCLSAEFSHSESIGEAWVRAENKGAVAYIGSAPNSYWFEDFYWSVGAFPISGDNDDGYVPSTEETTTGTYDSPFTSDYHAVAASKFVGNLAVTEADVQGYQSHSSPLYYWQAYQTFGDPSTIIYLTEGEENVVSHPDSIQIGMDYFTLEALPGSYVAISMDGVLHGVAFVDEGGEVEVPIKPIEVSGEVDIVVTKPQYIPYMEKITAVAAGAYANFKAEPTNILVGETVIFTDTSDPDDGEFVTWKWSFGEGADPASITGEGPHEVIYNTPGQKTVSLIIDDEYERVRKDYISVSNIVTLAIDINGEGIVEVDEMIYTEPMQLAENSTYSIKAISDKPWCFAEWTGDLTSTDNPENILMDVDKYIIANFSKVASNTYVDGDISTDVGFEDLSNVSGCPGTLAVYIPLGATITGVDVAYEMTALPDTPEGYDAYMSEQRSQLHCVSPGGTEEETIAFGSGDSHGTYYYSRKNLDIANGVEGGGNILFELHAGRTWGGEGCNTVYNKVDDGTWSVTVYYSENEPLIGDLNGDGFIDILDLVMLVNHILESKPYDPVADVNEDGLVDVDDLVALVDIILEKSKSNKKSQSETAYIDINDLHISFESDGTIAAIMFEIEAENAKKLNPVLINDDFELAYKDDENSIRAIVYSMNNAPMPEQTESIIVLEEEPINMEWGDLLASSITAKAVDLIPKSTIDITDPLLAGVKLKVYPNPSKGLFNLKMEMPEEVLVKITVYDIMGRNVKSMPLTVASKGKSEMQIKMSEYIGSGLYILKMEAFKANTNLLLLKDEVKILVE